MEDMTHVRFTKVIIIYSNMSIYYSRGGQLLKSATKFTK